MTKYKIVKDALDLIKNSHAQAFESATSYPEQFEGHFDDEYAALYELVNDAESLEKDVNRYFELYLKWRNDEISNADYNEYLMLKNKFLKRLKEKK